LELSSINARIKTNEILDCRSTVVVMKSEAIKFTERETKEDVESRERQMIVVVASASQFFIRIATASPSSPMEDAPRPRLYF
jgi:hypothetical protein